MILCPDQVAEAQAAASAAAPSAEAAEVFQAEAASAEAPSAADLIIHRPTDPIITDLIFMAPISAAGDGAEGVMSEAADV